MTGCEAAFRGLKVALVHDWLVTWGGSESVLYSLARIFPDAPIFTSLWHPVPRVRDAFADRSIRTSWLQSLPFSGKNHRRLLPLMPRAFRAMDLSGFDLVISDSHAFSKAVRVGPGALHICYCHTPPRYLWDLTSSYLPGFRQRVLKPVLDHLRKADLEAARGVTLFVANSAFVGQRIRETYQRDSKVIFPPVDVDRFTPAETREDYYVAGGRLVPYKRVDLAVEAANAAGFPLRVFGHGPQAGELRKAAGPTVTFSGELDSAGVGQILSRAKGFLFPGIEDFGILPVEAQAAGLPVVAYSQGGGLETVVEGETGCFFHEPTAESLLDGIEALERKDWDPEACTRNAQRFSRERFEEEFVELVEAVLQGRR